LFEEEAGSLTTFFDTRPEDRTIKQMIDLSRLAVHSHHTGTTRSFIHLLIFVFRHSEQVTSEVTELVRVTRMPVTHPISAHHPRKDVSLRCSDWIDGNCSSDRDRRSIKEVMAGIPQTEEGVEDSAAHHPDRVRLLGPQLAV